VSTRNVLMRYFSSNDWCFSNNNTIAVENGVKFEIVLATNYTEEILKIEVDDCLFNSLKFRNKKKCDFAFQRGHDNSFIFVELKNIPTEDGIAQLDSTISEFIKAFEEFGESGDTTNINETSVAFFVYFRATTMSLSTLTNAKAKFCRKYKIPLYVEESPYTMFLT